MDWVGLDILDHYYGYVGTPSWKPSLGLSKSSLIGEMLMRGVDHDDDGKVMVVFSSNALASVSNLLECNDGGEWAGYK